MSDPVDELISELLSERIKLAEKIERLRAALAYAESAHETYCKSWDMRKQMGRMKGALERIANEPHTSHEMKFIARAALENRHG